MVEISLSLLAITLDIHRLNSPNKRQKLAEWTLKKDFSIYKRFRCKNTKKDKVKEWRDA